MKGMGSKSEFEEQGEELLLIGKLRKKKKKNHQLIWSFSAGREEMTLRQPMKSKGLLR